MEAGQIKTWRETARFTEHEAAKYIGLGPVQYRRIEKGQQPTPSYMARIVQQWYAVDALLARLNMPAPPEDVAALRGDMLDIEA